MNIHLVAVQDFGPYTKGSLITDPAHVASLLAGEAADKVVRFSGPDTAPGPSTLATSEA